MSIGEKTSVQDNVLIHVAKHNAAGKVRIPAARASTCAAALAPAQLLVQASVPLRWRQPSGCVLAGNALRTCAVAGHA